MRCGRKLDNGNVKPSKKFIPRFWLPPHILKNMIKLFNINITNMTKSGRNIHSPEIEIRKRRKSIHSNSPYQNINFTRKESILSSLCGQMNLSIHLFNTETKNSPEESKLQIHIILLIRKNNLMKDQKQFDILWFLVSPLYFDVTSTPSSHLFFDLK